MAWRSEWNRAPRPRRASSTSRPEPAFGSAGTAAPRWACRSQGRSCRSMKVMGVRRDGVARGLIAADGFNAIRSLLRGRTRFARRQRPFPHPGSRGRRGTWRQGVEGRWTVLPAAQPIDDIEELAETVAWQLLLRWGVVFRDVYLKERLAVPWREILWALRRLEARGLIRGGRFVTGVTGEQFAEETTAPLLRRRRAA